MHFFHCLKVTEKSLKKTIIHMGEFMYVPVVYQSLQAWAKLWSRRWKGLLCPQNAPEVLDTGFWHVHRTHPDTYGWLNKRTRWVHWQNLHWIRWQCGCLCRATLSWLLMLHFHCLCCIRITILLRIDWERRRRPRARFHLCRLATEIGARTILVQCHPWLDRKRKSSPDFWISNTSQFPSTASRSCHCQCTHWSGDCRHRSDLSLSLQLVRPVACHPVFVLGHLCHIQYGLKTEIKK